MNDRIQLREITASEDQRGTFARLMDIDWGFEPISQVSISTNTHIGTLRGMHGMVRSAKEFKAVTCLSGSMLDVVVDLRPESDDYLKPNYFELNGIHRTTVLIPPGCIHGFITLQEHTEVLYCMSAPFDSRCEVGFRWDDPLLAIRWPTEPAVISRRDREFHLLHTRPAL